MHYIQLQKISVLLYVFLRTVMLGCIVLDRTVDCIAVVCEMLNSTFRLTVADLFITHLSVLSFLVSVNEEETYTVSSNTAFQAT